MKSIGLCLVLALKSAAVAGDGLEEKTLRVGVEVSMDYLLYLPDDLALKETWPLLLFLHGAGERGDDVKMVQKHGPPKLIAAGKKFPFIVVAPQCKVDHWWQPIELSALLDQVSADCPVDPDRIYVTGLSMGGFGTWELAAHSPDRFAAIVPICGGGETFWTRRFPKLPVWVFHGAKDKAVPLQRSKDMVDALKRLGSDVDFTIYPNAAHDSWTETYENPQLYEWLLEKKRLKDEG